MNVTYYNYNNLPCIKIEEEKCYKDYITFANIGLIINSFILFLLCVFMILYKKLTTINTLIVIKIIGIISLLISVIVILVSVCDLYFCINDTQLYYFEINRSLREPGLLDSSKKSEISFRNEISEMLLNIETCNKESYNNTLITDNCFISNFACNCVSNNNCISFGWLSTCNSKEVTNNKYIEDYKNYCFEENNQIIKIKYLSPFIIGTVVLYSLKNYLSFHLGIFNFLEESDENLTRRRGFISNNYSLNEIEEDKEETELTNII